MSLELPPVVRPVLRYHGAKFRIAQWVIGMFPPHECYVEPFGGAAGVLLQKPRSYSEVYNDLDGDVVNFFSVLRDPELRTRLIDSCVLTPYSRTEFKQAWEHSDDAIDRARRLAIRAQMGFGSAGATKGTTGFRIDTRREYGTAQHHWALYPDAISKAGHRLAGVLIENKAAIDVMREHDSPTTLHYVDPPYMHSTRVIGRGKARYYKHEMSDEQHTELLSFIQTLAGMVIISGYRSDLYEQYLSGWQKRSTKSRINAGRGGAVRIECVWINPACSTKQSQARLFA